MRTILMNTDENVFFSLIITSHATMLLMGVLLRGVLGVYCLGVCCSGVRSLWMCCLLMCLVLTLLKFKVVYVGFMETI